MEHARPSSTIQGAIALVFTVMSIVAHIGCFILLWHMLTAAGVTHQTLVKVHFLPWVFVVGLMPPMLAWTLVLLPHFMARGSIGQLLLGTLVALTVPNIILWAHVHFMLWLWF
jgi:hypothetical protein